MPQSFNSERQNIFRASLIINFLDVIQLLKIIFPESVKENQNFKAILTLEN
jgi:hypothetical protein